MNGITAPADTTIVSATTIATPVSYCRVDGYVTTTNPGPNKVNFMVALPHTWNGRFLFTVQGGAAGYVPDPTAQHLSEGYAIASTDKGVVVSHILDFSFRSNPAMALDWNSRGTHVTAVASQAIARQYYGRERLHRYVMGCSGGGVGTLMEAEAYPQDFDGFIPGATVTDWKYGNTLLWAIVARHLSAHPSAWISPDEYKRIHRALLAKYDARDSAVDSLIWDPSVIKLDGSDRATLSFLSDAQFDLLKLMTTDVKDATGKVVTPGYMLGNPERFPAFMTGLKRPPWTNLRDYPAGFMVVATAAQGEAGQDFSYLTDKDVMSYPDPKPGIDHGVRFDHRRLKALMDGGGKMILWTGVAEEAVPSKHLSGYYDRLSAAFPRQSANAVRFFTVPGLHHCQGGANAPTDVADKALKAAQRWVEEGVAPGELVLSNAKGAPSQGAAPSSLIPETRRLALAAAAASIQAAEAEPARTYLLCAAPARSVFKGGPQNPRRLDVNDARNWTCKR